MMESRALAPPHRSGRGFGTARPPSCGPPLAPHRYSGRPALCSSALPVRVGIDGAARRRVLVCAAVVVVGASTQQSQHQKQQQQQLILYRNPRGRVFRLRPYRCTDAAALVNLQTDSFFQPPGLPALRAMAYANIKAEVVSGLRQKEHSLRVEAEAFQLFVAEDVTAALRDAPAGLLPTDLWEHRAVPAVPASSPSAPSSGDGAIEEAPLLFVVLSTSQLGTVSALAHAAGANPGAAAAAAAAVGAAGTVTRQELMQPQRPVWDELICGELVGAVELTLMDELEVLRHLAPRQPHMVAGAAVDVVPPPTPSPPPAAPSSRSTSSPSGSPAAQQLPGSFLGPAPPPRPLKAVAYAYVSSMAVSTLARRQGVAHALLHCAERQALHVWRQPDFALHVHEDNMPAVRLYKKYGFQLLDQDPSWKRLLGGRVRLLMHRSLPVHALPPLAWAQHPAAGPPPPQAPASPEPAEGSPPPPGQPQPHAASPHPTTGGALERPPALLGRVVVLS